MFGPNIMSSIENTGIENTGSDPVRIVNPPAGGEGGLGLWRISLDAAQITARSFIFSEQKN